MVVISVMLDTSVSPTRRLSVRLVGTGQSVKEGLGHPKP